MDGPLPDAWWLYERTVQAPAACAGLLEELHGGRPQVLGEDFAGSGALARAWVERDPARRAFAVDCDAAALARAAHPRIRPLAVDVRAADVRAAGPCDVVHAGNFSIGELPGRGDLVGWARTAWARLAPGGVVAVDTYGGESAWRLGALERRRRLDDEGREVRWTWEQRAADPRTARVVNALSFRLFQDDVAVLDLPDAFVYRWRLWSIPELADALAEAGFTHVEVRTHLAGTEGPVDELAAGCVALVVARR